MAWMEISKLRLRAEKSLRANFVETEKGLLLTAGTHQFKTLWTRDFCFSIPGLLSIREAGLVERQLGLILSQQRWDGLLPRGIDVISPKLRVLHGLYGQRLTGSPITYSGKPLVPEFRGEHGTIAVDSNLLTILGALQLTKHTPRHGLLEVASSPVSEILSLLQPLLAGGPAFATGVFGLAR